MTILSKIQTGVAQFAPPPPPPYFSDFCRRGAAMNRVLNCRLSIAILFAVLFIPSIANAQDDFTLVCGDLDEARCTDARDTGNINNALVTHPVIPGTIPQGGFYRTNLHTLRGIDLGDGRIRSAPDLTIGELRINRPNGTLVEFKPAEFFNGTAEFTVLYSNQGDPTDGHGGLIDIVDYPFQITVECPTMGCRTPPPPAMADDDNDRRDEFVIASSGMLAATWLFNRYVASTALQDKLTTYALPMSDEHYEYGFQFTPSDKWDVGLSVTDKSYVDEESDRDNFYNLKIEYRF